MIPRGALTRHCPHAHVGPGFHMWCLADVWTFLCAAYHESLVARKSLLLSPPAAAPAELEFGIQQDRHASTPARKEHARRPAVARTRRRRR